MENFRVNNLNQNGREEHKYFPSEENAYKEFLRLIRVEAAYDIRVEFIDESGESERIAEYTEPKCANTGQVPTGDYCCVNCGGGFSLIEMVFSKELDGDFCQDCYPLA